MPLERGQIGSCKEKKLSRYLGTVTRCEDRKEFYVTFQCTSWWFFLSVLPLLCENNEISCQKRKENWIFDRRSYIMKRISYHAFAARIFRFWMLYSKFKISLIFFVKYKTLG